MKALARMRQFFGGAKALTTMRHVGGRVSFFDMLLPGTTTDYEKEVGDGLGSSVLMAPLNFLMRTFPEAPPIVEEFDKTTQWSEIPEHPLTRLLRAPNPHYGGRVLWMSTVLDFAFGNAYWLKLRNTQGQVVQLWWVPRQSIAPVWPSDGSQFISHYDYSPGGTGKIRVETTDVVHFRFGMDPRNPRIGLSQLGALMRDVAMDDNAASFATAILKNLGVIGVVVSPKAAGGPASESATKEVKEYLKKHFKGDKRADPLALGAPTDVNLLQYNMQGFDVSPLRDVSEERVCAALGLPAAVVGFGTGLQQTKVGATMKEMRQLAWTGGLIPMQEIMADEINRSLLPDMDSRPEARRMRFDTSKVRALWEDAKEKHERVRQDWLAGLIRKDEARRETGRPFDESDKVYVQPVNLFQIDPTTGLPKPAPKALPATTEDESDVAA